MGCDSTFVENKGKRHQATHDDETDDFGRVPRIGGSSKVETKQYHDHDADDTNTPGPVNGLDALGQLGSWVMNVEEDEQQDEGRPADGKVDPKDPPP